MKAPECVKPPRQPDFEAEIKALTTEEGGRIHLFFSGYRPNHNFGLENTLNDAMHEYLDGDILELGLNGRASPWLFAHERTVKSLIHSIKNC